MSCIKIAALLLHTVSWHSRSGYNDFNPGLGISTQCGIEAGAYYNSDRRITAYLGYGFDPPNLPIWASVDIASGYKIETGHRITPLAIVGVKSPVVSGYVFRVGVIPRVAPLNYVTVVHFMIEKRF